MAIRHVDLHEGSGQLLRLVRRGRLAGTQANDDVIVAHRLSRPKRQIARDAVALVDKADHRNSLGHRSRSGRKRIRRSPNRLRLDLPVGRGLILVAPAAGGERKQPGGGSSDEEGTAHEEAAGSYSGVQA